MTAPSPAGHPATRIAYLSFSSGEFDARTFRMARSAVDAGYQVTVYCRWHPGLPQTEEREGYRLIRAPFDWRLAIPGVRRILLPRVRIALANAVADGGGDADDQAESDDPATDVNASGGLDGSTGGEGGAKGADDGTGRLDRLRGTPLATAARLPRRAVRKVRRRVVSQYDRWRRLLLMFPLRPMGWAYALREVAEPADIWHGMWAGSLPGLVAMRRRHGGRTIYDSRDVYMHSRDFSHAGRPGKTFLARLERRWAHAADHVMTVNDAYADLLVRQLRVARPSVVMNCPDAWSPPDPRPDLIRGALGLQPDTRVVLYQGHLASQRGIEQAMAAILKVPSAVLVLLGFGTWLERLRSETSRPPYHGRVFLLPPVPPSDLLHWTASADVSVMAIAPTTVNHRHSTPQKLFESLAAGVPVVASDLPGMAEVVDTTGAGILCDPTSPAAIAAAIRTITDAPAETRETLRRTALRAAHDRYNWAAQLPTLWGVYRSLAPAGRVAGSAPHGLGDTSRGGIGDAAPLR